MEKFDHKAIEQKWRKRWEEDKLYQPDLKNAEKPFYNLMMFPYPSAEGLHVGSVFTFSGIDAFGRFMRMNGFDVFEPIGLDAFGIHSENYALKTNTHPMELAERTEKNFYRQLHEIGNGFAWSHKLETNKPDYYKWTQWLFLQLYKKGLAERKKAQVNWCPSCLTVLADEQVINGRCERCNTEVTTKELEQWFFKITNYADRLLKNLDWIDWDESVKSMQRNWIGKKTGAVIKFSVEIDGENEYIEVFTTRPDTIYGVTAIVLAPENNLVNKITTKNNKNKIEQYVKSALLKTELERQSEGRVKTGVKTDCFAIHPLTKEEIPIWISDYVIGSYGTGVIMLVPAHDQRDLDFANTFSIPIKTVIKVNKSKSAYHTNIGGQKITDSNNRKYRVYIGKSDSSGKMAEAQEEPGMLISSGEYTGMSSENASEKIVTDLTRLKCGYQKTTYHIRDWLISRQRYWGPPIPMIYCVDCGTVPVPEKDLPVLLPYIENFRPTGTGKSPLASHPEFYKTKCPNCHKDAHRETDVSDTFLDSSWYFLRYPSVGIDDRPFDIDLTKKWLPVHSYIGGKEHTVLHLLYSRFIAMVLHDLGYLAFEEPYTQFRPNGLIIKDGAKMSKSKGNVINPDDYIERYGSDILRCYLAFLGPFSVGGDFRDAGINGMKRFVNRVWEFVQRAKMVQKEPASEETYFINKTIKKVTEDIKELHYNTALAAIMEFTNFLVAQQEVSSQSVKTLLQLLAPFAPHITEELWIKIGQEYSIHTSSWPRYDPAKIVRDTIEIVVQINGKTRDRLAAPLDSPQEAIEAMAKERERVLKYLAGKSPKRVVYIPNKLMNIVV